MDQPVSHNAPPRGWWSRNWKWCVPAGCVTLILVAAAGFVGILALVFGLIRSSDIYKDSVAKAKTHPAVVGALGAPVEEGWYVMGQIHLVNDGGFADLQIPLSGPKDSGTLHVKGTRLAGVWKTERLELRAGKRAPVNLLEPVGPRDAPVPETEGQSE